MGILNVEGLRTSVPTRCSSKHVDGGDSIIVTVGIVKDSLFNLLNTAIYPSVLVWASLTR
jgi:hypothetical protein